MGQTPSLEDELRQRIASLESELATAQADRAFLFEALDRIPVALEYYDANGVARWLNRAMLRFLGIPNAEAVIGKFNILTDPFSIQTGLKPVYERAYGGELVVSEEYTIDMERAADDWGSEAHSIWFRMVLVPQLDKDGAVQGVCAIVRETTQERHMQQTLRLAQRGDGLELLAGGVAHDFNNLLTAILGQASVLAAGIAEPGEVVQCGEEIVLAAQQAAALTSQLLAYAGKGRGTLVPTDLRTLIREIAQLLRVTFSKTTEVTLDLDETPAVALVDGAQIKQVMMNLITNAYQSLPQGQGTVRVVARVVDISTELLARVRSNEPLEPGRYVRVDVIDDGCGMDAATVRRVFEPYFTTKANGHGLGLAATLGVVMGHHGAIHIESEPGNGSRFRVLLPYCASIPVLASPRTTTSSSDSGLVLVADDERYIRSLVRQVLERSGYGVLEADNGLEVQRLLAEHGDEIDMILMDVMMPGANGLDALESLRERFGELPVVLMSAHSEAGHAAARSDPYTWFLPKPFRAEAVLEALTEARRGVQRGRGADEHELASERCPPTPRAPGLG